MAKIEIDGKEVEAQPGEMLIQAADREGVYIPRFCYHKKLSVAANCRMCLVEVEKAPKALPACATPVAEGMKVFTKSEKAIQAQKTVMEFLLINHPLDCPICDQGGQCELQDLSMGFGADTSGFVEMKRSVPDPDLGPLIATEMNRCIHCTRCVRFEDEIAGKRELGAMFRGEHTKIGTYVKHTISSELSGNAIDVCPVGALTSKPFRFKARAWELTQTPSIAAHDCLGSHINCGTLRGEMLRVTPRECEAINEVWLSDRDRFAYTGVYSKQRLTQPMIKENGKWKTVSWQQAFDHTLKCLQTVLNAHGVNSFGALASPSATTEELYLLQRFMRGIGSNNIDHRLRAQDVSDQEKLPRCLNLGVSVADLALQDTVFLVGSDINTEQPIAGMKVRQAALKGAAIYSLNMMDYETTFAVKEKQVVKPGSFSKALASVAKALAETTGTPVATALAHIEVTPWAEAAAKALLAGQKKTIILGALALNHTEGAVVRALTHMIADLSGATAGCLTEGANSAGASLAGCLPHRGPAGVGVEEAGLCTADMLQQALKAYLLLGVEPELDCAHSSQALQAMRSAECVIGLTSFATDSLLDYATILLPIASFGETSGTYVNIESKWQSFNGVVAPKGEARPAWKVLRVLGNIFQLEGFEYTSSEEVLEELRRFVEANDSPQVVKLELPALIDGLVDGDSLQRIGDKAGYATDSLVRQAEPLQEMMAQWSNEAVQLNAATAARLGLKAEQVVTVRQDGQLRMPVAINERVPDGCILLRTGITETVGLGDPYGVIEIQQ